MLNGVLDSASIDTFSRLSESVVATAGVLGTAGGGLAGYKMSNRTGGVDEFEFQPVRGEGGGGEGVD